MVKPNLVSTYFRRYEQKYLMNRSQYEEIAGFLPSLVKADHFGKSMVCTIYYDTDDFTIIRKARNTPLFKEKLRLRAYGVPGPEDMVFLELKKKFKGITYKRRISLPLALTQDYNSLQRVSSGSSFVINEISWFLLRYKPTPKVLIGCNRTAFQGIENPALRITVDTKLHWRKTDLDLSLGLYGEPLLEDDEYLMELKVDEAIPLSLSRMMTKLKIFPISYSKYSKAYETMILNA
jgi:SPX domain protein involved in polyphosphate accumulation